MKNVKCKMSNVKCQMKIDLITSASL